MKISVIIPCYGAPNAIVELHDQLKTVLSTLTEQYEIILVNDNCPKGSWEKIIEVANKDSNVKGINLSRNFGQHAAISCGIEHVTGEWAVVMDCDLQDCPSYIVRLFEKAQSGYEVVVARRVYRNESFFKKCLSWMFYKFLKMVLDVHMDHQVGNFGIYSKQVLSSIHAMGDRVRFFPYLVSWVGFRHTTVDVEQNLRTDGKSSYSLWKALMLAVDIAISSSGRPLIWSVVVGIASAFSSFCLGIYFFSRYFLSGQAPSGWTSLSVTIFFSTGVILSSLGILGLYLLRVYDQTKNRPIYIVREYTSR